MKEETIKELAEKYYPQYPDGVVTTEINILREGFIKGYKVSLEINNNAIIIELETKKKKQMNSYFKQFYSETINYITQLKNINL